jgi:O-antigen ligase
MPWVIGRCYFGSLHALRELAVGMFIGALVYVPLCVFEMFAGAVLHLRIYGYYQHDPTQSLRVDGSVRPMVFMPHGLMLSMWMGSSALVGLAVVRDWASTRLPGLVKTALAATLVLTTLLSRSIGASVLMCLGIAIWLMARWLRVAFPVFVLLAAIPAYMTLRGTGSVQVSDLTEWISGGLQAAGLSQAESAARLESARVRFESEDRLLEQARKQPVFGISAWGFNQIVDPETGETVTVTTDGFWTIQLATRGIAGLAAWTALLLLPVLLFLRRHPPATWRIPLVAIGGALSLVLLLYTADCLMNANINPIFTLIAGGMCGLPAIRIAKRAALRRERLRAITPA